MAWRSILRALSLQWSTAGAVPAATQESPPVVLSFQWCCAQSTQHQQGLKQIELPASACNGGIDSKKLQPQL
jgi:hypothetical protein